MRPLVDPQVVLHPEAPGTHIALEGFQVLVDVFVLPEGLLRGERLSTAVADGPRFRRCVDIAVPSQRRRTVEPGRTDRTGVPLCVSVNAQVSLHVGFGLEVLRADFAQERADSLVLDFMAHEGLPGGELLIALVAGEIEVDGDVVSEAAFPSEASRTFRAGERFLAGVDD